MRWVENLWFEVASWAGPPSGHTSKVPKTPTLIVPSIPLAQLLQDYERRCAVASEIIAAHPLDDTGKHPDFDEGAATLRWRLRIHMVEETARHAGHLNAIRELLDAEELLLTTTPRASWPAPPGLRPTESCLLVPVPEAEQAVGALRGRLDRAAAWGVPAHVTILFPFVPPEAITGDVVDAAAAAVASVRAFDCVFARTSWFGQDVLWLAPEPDEPLRALTRAAHEAFPQYPPFGGIYPDVVPHLTIGDRPPRGPGALEAAEADVKPVLPVRTKVSHAWLMTGTQAAASWRVIAELPLSA